MRIIGGSARSRKFAAPKGEDTRPTLDKVRESLFNILQGKTIDAKVLDLFAGSGALAFEAISRGASEGVLVDVDRQVAQLLQKNGALLGFENQTTILCTRWEKALMKLTEEKRVFDLIFIDPPYQMANQKEIFVKLVKNQLLTQEGYIIYEHDTAHEKITLAELSCFDQRKYGDTWLSFYRLTQNKE